MAVPVYPSSRRMTPARDYGDPTGRGTLTSLTGVNGVTATPSPITGVGTVGLSTIANDRILANVSGGAAVPTPNTLSAILDACLPATLPGSIAYRGATWTALDPDTPGKALMTNGGAGLPPAWRKIEIGTRVDSYNAVPDGLANSTASVTAGSDVLTVGAGGSTFTMADVGKTIWIERGGAAGTVPHKTTIKAFHNANEVVLTDVAVSTVLNGGSWWGTDNTAHFVAALATMGNGYRNLILSEGRYLVDGPLTTNAQFIAITGQGAGATTLSQMSTTASLIEFTFPGQDLLVKDLRLEGPGASSTGIAISYPSGAGFNSQIRNCLIEGFGTGIDIQGPMSGYPWIINTDAYHCGIGCNSIGGVTWLDGLVYSFPSGIWAGGAPDGLSVDILVNPFAVTSTSSKFTTSMVGQRIVIRDAGTPIGGVAVDHVTTIAAVTDATHATLTAPAVVSKTNVAGFVHTYTTAGIQDTGPLLLRNFDVSAASTGLVVAPNGSPTAGSWLNFITGSMFDTCYDQGVLFQPGPAVPGGQIISTNFEGCWFAGNGSDGSGGFTSEGPAVKLYLAGGGTIYQTHFNSCRFVNNSGHGLLVTGGPCGSVAVNGGCVFDGNGGLKNATYAHIWLSAVTDAQIIGNHFGNEFFNSAGTMLYGVLLSDCAGNIVVEGNSFKTSTYGVAESGTTTTLTTKKYANNVGFNPYCNIPTPVLPASTVPLDNTTGLDVTVYIATGAGVTVSAVVIGGVTTGLTLAASSEKSVLLPAGATIALTYAGGAPTWVWVGN